MLNLFLKTERSFPKWLAINTIEQKDTDFDVIYVKHELNAKEYLNLCEFFIYLRLLTDKQ